jgi:hypothetical protein
MSYPENQSYEQVVNLEAKHDDSNAQPPSEPAKGSAATMQDEISDLRSKYSQSDDSDNSFRQEPTNNSEPTAQDEHLDLRSKYSQPKEAVGGVEPQTECESNNLA